MSSIKTVTQEGYNKMVEELQYLTLVRRQEITEAIRVALSFGDLSENSEYDEAKTEQAKVETRISELEELLKNVTVISTEDISTDSVSIGTKVTLLNITDNKEVVYSLVGFGEANPSEKKISDQSPIGKAINHAKIGDEIEVEVPRGKILFKILKIEKD